MHIENLGFFFFFFSMRLWCQIEKKKMVALRIERVGNGRKQWE